MPIQVVHGESTNRTVALALAGVLRQVVDEGTVYLGYPVLATADDRVNVDALLVSRAHGVAVFQFSEAVPASPDDWSAVVAAQDRLFGVLESYLGRHDNLRSRRRLVVALNTVTLFPAPVDHPPETEGAYLAIEEVAEWVRSLPGIDEEAERNVQAALQRVTSIKPSRKRSSVVQTASRGAILKEIEKGIANLDRWQKMAAIESPEGPQRIRGLAGSGKTVVLALKAAYWHSQHPDWKIAVTFHSRALYQQIDDLVTRFTFEHTNEPPDTEHLQITHSWGSRDRSGVYSIIAVALGETPRDWAYARGRYGMDDAFRGVCQELLAIARSRLSEPIFDAVLVDEAQDLPPEFFQLVYLFTKEPKRVVWAYDELHSPWCGSGAVACDFRRTALELRRRRGSGVRSPTWVGPRARPGRRIQSRPVLFDGYALHAALSPGAGNRRPVPDPGGPQPRAVCVPTLRRCALNRVHAIQSELPFRDSPSSWRSRGPRSRAPER